MRFVSPVSTAGISVLRNEILDDVERDYDTTYDLTQVCIDGNFQFAPAE